MICLETHKKSWHVSVILSKSSFQVMNIHDKLERSPRHVNSKTNETFHVIFKFVIKNKGNSYYS